MRLIIPARAGSKGFPGKNRKLFKSTLKEIPAEFRPDTIVSTDDEEIKKMCEGTGVKVHHRNSELSSDEASTRDVLLNIAEEFKLLNEDMILLYLTYPQRDWLDIISIYHFFQKNKFRSLLCRLELKSHPYLCMYELPNNRGKQIIEHDLCRRQDYPKMFEISHYIGIFKSEELFKLNKNLYNLDTYFYPIDHVIDVDYEKDYDRYKSGGY